MRILKLESSKKPNGIEFRGLMGVLSSSSWEEIFTTCAYSQQRELPSQLLTRRPGRDIRRQNTCFSRLRFAVNLELTNSISIG